MNKIYWAALVPALMVSVAQAAPAWQEGQSYASGAIVSFAGHDYQALVAHTAYVGAGWTPAATATLWRDLGVSSVTPTATPSIAPTLAPTVKPTAAPTPSAIPTAAPTSAPTATPAASTIPGGGCVTAWQAGVAYTSGKQVSFQGRNYEAKWWTDTAPTNDQWGPWKDLGACGSVTPAPTLTATPTVKPTATPQITPAPTAVPTSTPTPTPVVTPTPKPSATPLPSATPAIPASGLLFDDFSYYSTAQLTNNGWMLRSWNGGPGISNGQWSPNNVSFITDAQGNTLLRLKASTNISGDQIVNNAATAGTSSQVELMTNEALYLNGTWAARMYFNDGPVRGPDGDSVIQTFFGITQYLEGREPYSEIDFEYLPNGGWGIDAPTMWTGTYEIAAYDPINHVAVSTPQSFAGWHTLVMNVADGYIRFYIDGKLVQSYSGIAQPDNPMFMAFQLWFSNSAMTDGRPGFLRSTELREYQEDIDWVFYLKDQQLTTGEVDALITNIRGKGLSFVKNVK